MKITVKTKVREVLPLLNEERIKAIADAVQPMALAKPLLSMTCGEFCQALTENYAMSFFGKDELAVVAFGRYKQYIAELESVTAYIKCFEVEQDGDEKAAAQGVDFPTMPERILLDCVRAYHLHSTEEAERLPVTDWLLVVKSEGAAAKYQRNLSKIRNRKQNGKHK